MPDENEVVIKDDQYFMEHQEEWDNLSDADRDKFATDGVLSVEADTDTELEAKSEAGSDAEAAAATDKKDDPPVVDPEKKPEAEPEKVLLAKDGKNIIPYSELEDSRAEVIKLQGIIDDNKPVVDQLKVDLEAAKAVDEKAGNTAEQEKILGEFKDDYPGIYAPIEKLMGSKVADLEQKITDLSEKFDSDIKPLKDGAVKNAQAEHDSLILGAHSNFQEIADSGKLAEWIDKQPAIMQRAYLDVTKNGSAQDVIELFDAYKEANPAEAAPSKESAKEAAKKAEAIAAGVEDKEPGSLSEVPGGKVHVNEAEAMQSESGQKLMGRFEGKTPDQINKMMDQAL